MTHTHTHTHTHTERGGFDYDDAEILIVNDDSSREWEVASGRKLHHFFRHVCNKDGKRLCRYLTSSILRDQIAAESQEEEYVDVSNDDTFVNLHPSGARNLAFYYSTGKVIFFLDGDDLYYPDHIHQCHGNLLAHPDHGFVRTYLHMADAIHPDWYDVLNYTMVHNKCVRRECHAFVEGFPEHAAFHEHDEDSVYSGFLHRYCRDPLVVRKKTVEYLHYPGNSYDTNLPRFRRPFAESGQIVANRVCVAVLASPSAHSQPFLSSFPARAIH